MREPKAALASECETCRMVVPSLLSRAEELHDFGGLCGVEIAGGLVGEKESGLVDDGAGDADQLLLTARELRGEEVFLGDDAEAIERVRRRGPGVRCAGCFCRRAAGRYFRRR